MQILVDTHSQTIASGHAYNTMREMAKMASEKGLEALALTEHAPGMEGTTHIFYFANLKVVPRQMYGIELLLGSELNILNEDGEIDLPPRILKQLDIRLASIHLPCYHGEKTKEAFTNAFVNAMRNPYVDIIGHPDDERFLGDMETIVKTAKETGTLLELNNASLTKECSRENTRENDIEMLKLCMKYGTMIVVGTDSHIDVRVGEFGLAKQLLEELDFPEELVANTSLKKLKTCLKRWRE